MQISADSDFQIILRNIYNPPNATDCTLFRHHLLSYFNTKLLKNDRTVTHSSLSPTNLNSPCQQYIVLRGDIMPVFPRVLYAGFVQEFSLTLSQPTKMLRVDLSCTDSAVSFMPNTFYFDSYDFTLQEGQISVTSLAGDGSNIFINITHE
jgi:hypothetical protein